MSDDIVSDNIIKVTVMLGNKSRLQERLIQFYPSKNGVYHFIEREDEASIIPENYPGISKKLIDFVFSKNPKGEIFQDGDKTRLLWWFSTPIMYLNQRMGFAHTLYDMAHDRPLMDTIQKKAKGDVFVNKKDRIFSLATGASLPFDTRIKEGIALKPEIHHLKEDLVLFKIVGFPNLYFQSSTKSLVREKKKVTLWMGVFSVLVLTVSTVMSVFLAKKMVGPLRDMTKKAIQISEGNKDLLFENGSRNYWEFNQLSQAFNYMLTNLKDAEEQSRYKELLENVDDAVYILDRKGKILEANEAAYSRLKYTPEDFFELDLASIVPQSDAQLIIEKLGKNPEAEDSKKMTLETSHKTTNGDLIPVEIQSRAIIYRGKNVILNVARDISQRIEAEKAKRESEERYRSVVEYSHDGIMIMDTDFKIVYSNDALTRILGYSPREIEGSDFRKYLGDGDVELASEHILSIKSGKNPPRPVFKIVCKNRDERSVKVSANRFMDSKGDEKIFFQIQDITDQLRAEQEKKHLEAQLVHAQKMEAVGTLAGGIAHDFNNLLMGIQGHVSLMRLQIDTDHPFDEYARGIESNVKSAANLTRQLLGFARKGKYEPRPTNLNDILEKSLDMFSRTHKEIRALKRFQKDIWTVEADPGQIEQVVINLYLNAWQAMPDGGELYVQSENVFLSDVYCKPFEAPGGNYTKISVTDTGVGMDPETMERIFEPFFTTKEVGKGTGLGLASVYYSEIGHGTTFDIHLPASDGDAPKDTLVIHEPLKGKETILLVDDEETPIHVEELMLKELGYSVLSARSGKEAIALYRENPENLDLVALDMIMPEMSGRQTYDELKKIRHDVKVLLLSGYSLNRQTEELLAKGCKGFIQKPFDIFQLSQKIREVLDG
jgi:PAS domain S-box-containing protein